MTNLETSPEKKASSRPVIWTDEERVHLLLRIISQLCSNGQTISWKDVRVPGRTPKSVEGQWTKLKGMMNDLANETGDVAATTATPGQRKNSGKKGVSKADDQDGGLGSPKSRTPRKRKMATPATPILPTTDKRLKIENEEGVDDGGEIRA